MLLANRLVRMDGVTLAFMPGSDRNG
jgi:hypothetical protein